jgi:hypothetical protein
MEVVRMPSRLSLALLALAALAFGGCATTTDADASESEGAVRAGAARRSGLVEGVYDGRDLSLEIIESDGRLMATLYFEDGRATTGSFVDVSVLGKVTIGDPIGRRAACDVRLDVESHRVTIDGTCAGKTISDQLSRRAPAAFMGRFSCTEKATLDAAKLSITNVDEVGVRIRAEAVKPGAALVGSFDGTWATKPLSFNAGRWGFHLPRPDRLVWHPNFQVRNGVPVNADGTPADLFAGGVCTRVR